MIGLSFSEKKKFKIINGIYVNPADTIRFQPQDTGNETNIRRRLETSKPFESMQSIKFDSLNNPVDTITNYIAKGNKVYKISDKKLKPGFSFVSKGDTLYGEEDECVIHLGPTCFLRILSDSMLVLNCRENLEWSDERGSWWQIFILEKAKDGSVLLREVQVDQEASLNNNGEVKFLNYYFDLQWTRKDMLKHAIGEAIEEYKLLKK